MPRILFAFLVVVGCGEPDDLELEHLIASSTIECGTLVFDNTPDSSCPDTAAALQCFTDGDRPHLVQQLTTEEGDPILEHFLVDDDAQIVLIRDTRADDFGPQELTRSACTDVAMSEATIDGCALLVCAR